MQRFINFLKPKSSVLNRPSFLRLASIYIIAFLVVFTVLNLSALADRVAYVKNKFTDDDEVLETELLQAAYSNQEPGLIHFQPQSTGIPGETISPGLGITTTKNTLYIPKINVKAPVIIGTSTSINQVLKELEKGVVMYPGSALPGQEGGTVIVGHSSSNSPLNKFGNIFSLLGKLEPGDLIYVNFNDRNYVYQIDGKKTGSIFALARADIGGDLVLSSCWPVGTDNGRILITATLQK